MKLFRWPLISFILALILAFVLFNNRALNYPAKKGISTLISYMCDTYSTIDSITLSPLNASLTANNLYIADPMRKDKPVMKAATVHLLAEPHAFLNEQVIINSLYADSVFLKLYQTADGFFTPFPEISGSQYAQNLSMRAERILSYSAEYANPLARITHADDIISSTPHIPEEPHVKPKTSATQLNLPAPSPDFILKELLLTNVTAILIPKSDQTTVPLLLHDALIAAENISSDPEKYAPPLRWIARGWLNKEKHTFVASATTIDVSPGSTNMTVSFVLSNATLSTFLPYIASYVDWLDALEISSGTLTTHGTITIENNRVLPGTFFIHLDHLTTRVKNTGAAPSWLRDFSMTDSSLKAHIPIDNTPPYVHVEQLADTRNFRGTLKDVKLRIKVDDLKNEFAPRFNSR